MPRIRFQLMCTATFLLSRRASVFTRCELHCSNTSHRVRVSSARAASIRWRQWMSTCMHSASASCTHTRTQRAKMETQTQRDTRARAITRRRWQQQRRRCRPNTVSTHRDVGVVETLLHCVRALSTANGGVTQPRLDWDEVLQQERRVGGVHGSGCTATHEERSVCGVATAQPRRHTAVDTTTYFSARRAARWQTRCRRRRSRRTPHQARRRGRRQRVGR
jgi:hypothetical protein